MKGAAFIADGAPCLWNLARECLPGAVEIQDFWHVAERLWALGRDLYGKESEGARTAGRKWKEMLWEGRVEEIVLELDVLSKRHRGEKRGRLLEEMGYLEDGRRRMDYPRYRAEGWPVGSGAVEATCKQLVKERMCVTGARWRRGNIPAVVALRLCRANDEWDRDFDGTATRAA